MKAKVRILVNKFVAEKFGSLSKTTDIFQKIYLNP